MQLRNRKQVVLLVFVLLVLAGARLCRMGRGWAAVGAPAPLADLGIPALQESFRNPPEDAKIMVRWWWFGPAVTTDELDRELHSMKDAGIGGVEVQPVYPLALDDPAKGLVNLQYLSPEFLAAVSSTARTAQSLGMRMDMTMGSGWPFGGSHITPELAARNLQCLRIPITAGAQTIAAPALQPGQRFLAAFVASGDPKHFDASSAHQIMPKADGSFPLPLSASGPRVLLFFIAGLTGQQVKRAAQGAEGNVLNHYSLEAAEKHFEVVGAPLVAAGDGKIRAMFCDSLEVVGSDWTGNFLKEFQARRGYDLTPHLPALFDEASPQAAAVRHDWGQTLTELLNQNFLQPYQAWCRAHHVLARVQAYGEPPAQLCSYRYVDLPEGEQGDEAGHWNHFTASRWASSAGHLYGAPEISAEAWTWIHWLPFRATPLDFKATADEYFLEGINQFVAHGYPYSPPSEPDPGWHFYAAGALGPHNPWWFAMPDLAAYLQRGSFMLRQGRPANDIAVYLPTDDAWAHLTPGHVNLWDAIWRQLGPDLLPTILEAGYNLDFIDDDTLAHQGHVHDGKLTFANQDFSVVILPGIERIPPATLAKLGEFARSGGTLIATGRLPSLAPGYLHQDSESAKVRRNSKEIFSGPQAVGRLVPIVASPLQTELNKDFPPDLALSPRTRDVGFVHRRTDTSDIFFIANTSNQRFEGTATFRIKGKNAEWWDLYTGEVTEALPASEGNAVLKLDLEPYGSRLVVFSNRRPAPGGEPKRPAHLPVTLDVSRGWNVTFESTGQSVYMDALRSWTDLPGMQYFSGRATYQKRFMIPVGYLWPGVRVELNLGEGTPLPVEQNAYFQAWLDGPVREAAEVYVNGQRAGIIWHPPYELDIGPFIHAGENDLRISVGNLAVNEMAGSPLPDRTALIARFGERFQDQGNNLVKAIPSGLMGPIRLIARPRMATIPATP